MRKILLIIAVFFISINKSKAQNRPIIYEFDELPQTLLLNPGAEVGYQYHVGFPLLSGISTNIGITEVTIADLFKKDGIDFNVKFRNALSRLTTNDYIQLNNQIEVLSGGMRLNEKNYLSAGFYSEIDMFAGIPKDILTLINEGNAAYVNKSFYLSQTNIKAEALGVLHVGLTRKVNQKLTVGARMKIYSGVLNITSTGNLGTFTTRLGQDNIYTHYLNNIDLEINSSGLYNEQNTTVQASTLIKRSFLGGNLGLGIDVGFTYKINEQTKLTASLLDLGFVSYSKDVRSGKIKGNYTFSGIEFQYDGNNVNYWGNLSDDFKAKVPREENRESYTVMRPVKINAAVKHSWGKTRKEEACYDMSYHEYYNNGVGAQFFSIIRPTGPKMALTGFYEKRLSTNFIGKLTYTVDDFSYSNIGLGISTTIGKVNVYGAIDNLFNLPDITNSNSSSFQIGVNLIFR